MFGRGAFTYDASHDRYQCPAGSWLPLKQVNGLQRIYAVRGDCAACPLKPRCTLARRRYVTRHTHEEALAVNAYNLKRAIKVRGARRLIELMG